MVAERWVPVIGYPRYLVSQLGNVYDQHSDRILGKTPDRKGYIRVKLVTPYGERKTVSLHRIVAGSFYDVTPEEFEDWEVNHRDGIKSHCEVWNLEFTDRSGNMLHAFSNGLATPVFSARPVRIVETGEIFESTGQVDRYLGVSNGSVSKTLRGLQPTCKGYTFEYV